MQFFPHALIRAPYFQKTTGIGIIASERKSNKVVAHSTPRKGGRKAAPYHGVSCNSAVRNCHVHIYDVVEAQQEDHVHAHADGEAANGHSYPVYVQVRGPGKINRPTGTRMELIIMTERRFSGMFMGFLSTSILGGSNMMKMCAMTTAQPHKTPATIPRKGS